MTFHKWKCKHGGPNTSDIRAVWEFKALVTQRRDQHTNFRGNQERYSPPQQARSPVQTDTGLLDFCLTLSAQNYPFLSAPLTPICSDVHLPPHPSKILSTHASMAKGRQSCHPRWSHPSITDLCLPPRATLPLPSNRWAQKGMKPRRNQDCFYLTSTSAHGSDIYHSYNIASQPWSKATS